MVIIWIKMPQLEERPLKRAKMESTTSLATLPEEVLVQVAGHLDQHDALSFLLTAKAFGKAARRRLYHKILICEKYQDTYFYELSRREKFTLLSSWESITKFFRYLHSNRDSPIYDYIEDLSSYNYLDHGNKVDKYKHISATDLNQLLTLRQCWEIVINNCKNLKKFVFPKLPIEKLMLLPNDIKENLIEISINLDDEQSNGLKEFNGKIPEMFHFPNLKKLVLNLDHKLDIQPIMFDIVEHIMNFQDGVNNVLEELEFNGNFGKLDRDFEHFLRHSSIEKDVSLKASFIEGFKLGESVFKHHQNIKDIAGSRKFRRTTVVDLESFEDESDDSDDDDYDDDDDIQEISDNEDDYIDESSMEVSERLEPVLANVNFEKPQVTNFNFGYNETSFDKLILENILKKGYKFKKLDKLTFNNSIMDRSGSQFISEMIVLHSDSLREVNFSNCYIFCEQGAETLKYSPPVSLLQLKNLENLTFGISPIDLSSQDTAFTDLMDHLLLDKANAFYEIPSVFKPDIKLIEDINLQSLSTVLSNCKQLKRLNVHLSSTVLKLEDFWKIFRNYKQDRIESGEDTTLELRNIKYINRVDVFKIIRKVINIKIIKKFNRFNNLNLLDDFHFGLFKKLIEFFNAVCRFDNYGTNRYEPSLNNVTEIKLFVDEFKYLFKDEVKPFFDLLDNLETFEYFGFTFYRKDVI